jgi:agmatine deiminase
VHLGTGTAHDARGKSLDVVTLPFPRAVIMDGMRLPASYANFLILNNAVLVPLFGNKKKDAAAEDKIAECFPGREIISMMAKDLVTEGGALHCIAMHQPK